MTTISIDGGAVYLISPDDIQWWKEQIAEFGVESGECECPIEGEIGRIEGVRIVVHDCPSYQKRPESNPVAGRPWYRRGRW